MALNWSDKKVIAGIHDDHDRSIRKAHFIPASDTGNDVAIAMTDDSYNTITGRFSPKDAREFAQYILDHTPEPPRDPLTGLLRVLDKDGDLWVRQGAGNDSWRMVDRPTGEFIGVTGRNGRNLLDLYGPVSSLTEGVTIR